MGGEGEIFSSGTDGTKHEPAVDPIRQARNDPQDDSPAFGYGVTSRNIFTKSVYIFTKSVYIFTKSIYIFTEILYFY